MFASRLLYPRKRTFAGSHLMSALGHKRTHALQHDLWIERNMRLIAEGSPRPYNARHERA